MLIVGQHKGQGFGHLDRQGPVIRRGINVPADQEHRRMGPDCGVICSSASFASPVAQFKPALGRGGDGCLAVATVPAASTFSHFDGPRQFIGVSFFEEPAVEEHQLRKWWALLHLLQLLQKIACLRPQGASEPSGIENTLSCTYGVKGLNNDLASLGRRCWARVWWCRLIVC